MLPLVVLTSGAARHAFFINRLAEHFDLRGVILEEKKPEKASETVEEDAIVKKHFAERAEAERRYFPETELNVTKEDVWRLENGRANDPDVLSWVKERDPKYVILFGSSIIKPPFLTEYEGRMINMHLGLSPYYRGAGTNFWPLVNNEPECVGATIHLAIQKVDAGAILGQVRPEAVESDWCHDLGCKTIIAGTEAMIQCIEKYDAGSIVPKTQDLTIGRVYKSRDFFAEAVTQMWSNFEKGMMREYLEHWEERLGRYPIDNV